MLINGKSFPGWHIQKWFSILVILGLTAWLIDTSRIINTSAAQEISKYAIKGIDVKANHPRIPDKWTKLSNNNFNPKSITEDATWINTAPMNIARYAHTATLLPNGKVLVVGGATPSGEDILASAEIYDPIQNLWTLVTSMHIARYCHTTTLLPNGKVLVVGGRTTDNEYTNSVEIYDPTTGIWKNVTPLASPRGYHTATLLLNGKVLIVGGLTSGNSAIISAELYDPVADMWTTVASLNIAHFGNSETLLSNGMVLIVGGETFPGYPTTYAEVYDPESNIWTHVASMHHERESQQATLLANNKVLIAGGDAGGINLDSTEVYDPIADTWTDVASMINAHYAYSLTLLPSGKVLVVGGWSNGQILANVEVYDPDSNSWSPIAPLNNPRYGQTATLLQHNRILIAGGSNFTSILTSTEIYAGSEINGYIASVDLSSNQFANVSPGTIVRFDHTLSNHGNFTDTIQLTAKSSQRWTTSVHPNVVEIPKDESTTIAISVTVPSGFVPAGLENLTWITATSSAPVGVIIDSVTDTSHVLQVAALTIAPGRSGLFLPGATAVYSHTVTNLGNARDTLNISASSSQGWVVNVVTPSFTLDPGESSVIQVRVLVPPDASNLTDVTTVAVTSAYNSAVIEEVMDTTMVGTARLYLPAVRKEYLYFYP